MKSTENLFDKIGQIITSLAAVIFVLISIITAMVLFSHTLFTSVFPASMQPWERTLAAWTMAIGFESTLLLTTVNTQHLNKRIPALMALCSGLIILFFLNGFDGSQSWLILSQRWLVGLMAAGINFVYSELFFAKWNERLQIIDRPMKLNQLESDLNAALSELNQARPKLNEINELIKYKSKIEAELVCPHCNVRQSSYGALHSHKGSCIKNPNSKKNKIVTNEHA